MINNEQLYKQMKKLSILKVDSSVTIKNEPYMPLVIERIEWCGRSAFSLCHYGKQNGDLMRDPEMVVVIDKKERTADAVYFRNDYTASEVDVYDLDDNGEVKQINWYMLDQLNAFLKVWLSNIEEQKFDIKGMLN